LPSAKAEQYTRVLNSQHTAEQAKAAAKEIESAEMEYQQVRAKIRSSNPHYASLMQPRPPSVTEIQATLLDSDTLLLEYALGDERSYVWALTTTSMSSYELPGRGQHRSGSSARIRPTYGPQ
jgi:hypothetical protein